MSTLSGHNLHMPRGATTCPIEAALATARSHRAFAGSRPCRDPFTDDSGSSGLSWLRSQVVCTAWVASGLLTMVMVFSGRDPVQARMWRCVDPDDTGCAAALAAPSPDVCGLPRGSWQWTARCAVRRGTPATLLLADWFPGSTARWSLCAAGV